MSPAHDNISRFCPGKNNSNLHLNLKYLTNFLNNWWVRQNFWYIFILHLHESHDFLFWKVSFSISFLSTTNLPLASFLFLSHFFMLYPCFLGLHSEKEILFHRSALGRSKTTSKSYSLHSWSNGPITSLAFIPRISILFCELLGVKRGKNMLVTSDTKGKRQKRLGRWGGSNCEKSKYGRPHDIISPQSLVKLLNSKCEGPFFTLKGQSFTSGNGTGPELKLQECRDREKDKEITSL